MQDIDLGAHYWSSIYTTFDSRFFIDGQFHSIYNLICQTNYTGSFFNDLFGYCKNIIFRNANINANNTGVVASYNGGDIENIAVYDSTIYSKNNYVGGIVGYNAGYILSCYFINTSIKCFEDYYVNNYQDYYYIDLQYVSGRWSWGKYYVTYKRAYYSKYHKYWRPNKAYNAIYVGAIASENHGTIKYCYFDGDISNRYISGTRHEIHTAPISYFVQPEFWDVDSVKKHFGYDAGVTLIGTYDISYNEYYNNVDNNSRSYLESVSDNRTNYYGNTFVGLNNGTASDCWYNTRAAAYVGNIYVGYNGNSFSDKSAINFPYEAGYAVSPYINNGWPHFRKMYWQDSI